jgi:hypothetical protein
MKCPNCENTLWQDELVTYCDLCGWAKSNPPFFSGAEAAHEADRPYDDDSDDIIQWAWDNPNTPDGSLNDIDPLVALRIAAEAAARKRRIKRQAITRSWYQILSAIEREIETLKKILDDDDSTG